MLNSTLSSNELKKKNIGYKFFFTHTIKYHLILSHKTDQTIKIEWKIKYKTTFNYVQIPR